MNCAKLQFYREKDLTDAMISSGHNTCVLAFAGGKYVQENNGPNRFERF